MAAAWWLRHYVYSITFGVFFIFIAGMINHNSIEDGLTGYSVLEDTGDEFYPSGKTETFYLESRDCELSPKTMYASVGDKIVLSASVFGDARQHRISIEGKGIDLVVRGNEQKYAEFYAEEPGTYEIVDVFPCQSQGYNAKSFLVIS